MSAFTLDPRTAEAEGLSAPRERKGSQTPPEKWSNGARRGRNPYARRLGGPLSRTQKAALCMLCREAFAAQGGERRLGLTLDEWRHEQVAAATGKPGLTACVEDDYKAIQARFLDLKGETGRALNAHVAHETEPVRVALYKLREALRAGGLHEGYAAVICRKRFRCELEHCNAKQLWQLVFTINNRR